MSFSSTRSGSSCTPGAYMSSSAMSTRYVASVSSSARWAVKSSSILRPQKNLYAAARLRRSILWNMVCASMSRHFEKSKSMPARRNSSASIGMSKWLELYPAKSQSFIFSFSFGAISLNVGASFTSSLLMPVSSVTSCGMALPGFTSMFSRRSSPSGITLIYEICIMRSRTRSSPVVSRSKTTRGRVRFSFII